jgi:hypothetical protein
MSPASADGRKPKRVTMLEEPTGLDGAGSTFARDSKDRPNGSGGASGPRGSAVSAGGTSPLGDLRASRVSFVSDPEARSRLGSSPANSPQAALDSWVKSTLKAIVNDVNSKEDPLQLNKWVKDVKDEIVAKVERDRVVSSTRSFAKSVLAESMLAASLADWSRGCLQRILEKEQGATSRRSSLALAAPMFLDATVQHEFGNARIVALEAGQADGSIELGQ